MYASRGRALKFVRRISMAFPNCGVDGVLGERRHLMLITRRALLGGVAVSALTSGNADAASVLGKLRSTVAPAWYALPVGGGGYQSKLSISPSGTILSGSDAVLMDRVHQSSGRPMSSYRPARRCRHLSAVAVHRRRLLRPLDRPSRYFLVVLVLPRASYCDAAEVHQSRGQLANHRLSDHERERQRHQPPHHPSDDRGRPEQFQCGLCRRL